jgi:hypothetical protein
MISIRIPVAVDGKDTTVVIDDPVIRTDTLEDQRRYFTEQGQRLEAALYEALPGGLYDQLLGAMHSRKASLFIVTHK